MMGTVIKPVIKQPIHDKLGLKLYYNDFIQIKPKSLIIFLALHIDMLPTILVQAGIYVCTFSS